MFVDSDLAVARLAERQHGVISRAQAIRSGMTSSRVARRLESGQWDRVQAGVYRLAGSGKSLEQAIQAACLGAGGRAVASHSSAAWLLRLPLERPGVEITIAMGRRVTLQDVIVHRTRSLERVDTLVVRGIPATSVARTLIDLASTLPATKLEGLLDHALANRLIPISYLRQRLESLFAGRDGAAVLAALVAKRPKGWRPRQSDAERGLLDALRKAGVRLPATQAPIRLPGARLAFPDLCYPEEKLIVEVDSYLHHSSLADWEHDHLRNQDLVELHWRILPVTAAEIERSPVATAEKVRRALRA